jgi:hypothetical protein
MFETKAELSQRELIYNVLRTGGVDQVFTLAELDEASGVDLVASRAALYDAIRLLQDRDRRTAVNVRGVGYRIAAAREHADQARNRRKRAGRQVRRGLETLRGTRVEDLSVLELAQHEQQTIRLDAHSRQLRQHDQRITSLEQAQAITEGRLKVQGRKLVEHNVSVEELNRKVARLEGLLAVDSSGPLEQRQ